VRLGRETPLFESSLRGAVVQASSSSLMLAQQSPVSRTRAETCLGPISSGALHDTRASVLLQEQMDLARSLSRAKASGMLHRHSSAALGDKKTEGCRGVVRVSNCVHRHAKPKQDCNP
jgi:hypothetical protein